MERQSGQIVAIVVGSFFGIVSLAVGSYDPLWDWLGTSEEVRGSMTIALTLFTLLAGFQIASLLKEREIERSLKSEASDLSEKFREARQAIQNDLSAATNTLQREIIRNIPHLTLFSAWTGDDAMREISARFHSARFVLNTRLFARDLNFVGNPGLRDWDSRLQDAIRDGLVYREVVSRGSVETARGRAEAVAEDASGSYSAARIDSDLPTFMNFSILEFPDSVKELWVGWVISPGFEYEQCVIRTTEARLIEMFERWHSALFAFGSPIVP